MTDGIAQDQLQAYVRRIESVEDEIKVLNEDKSEIYKEARGAGFDVKILRKVIAARRMDAEERREQGEMFELYWDAIHGVSYRVVRAHVENIDEFDADGVLIEPQLAPQAGSDLTEAHPLSNGQVADIQPETANEAGGDLTGRAVQSVAAGHSVHATTAETTNGGSDESDHPAHPVSVIDPGRRHADEIDATAGGGHHEVASTSAQIVIGEGAHNASVTSFIPKPLRPYCLNREVCGGQGRQHCYKCQKAHDEKQGAA